MSINICVGNLLFDANRTGRKETSEATGVVNEAEIIPDRFTDRSERLSLLEMLEHAEGLTAIKGREFREFKNQVSRRTN